MVGLCQGEGEASLICGVKEEGQRGKFARSLSTCVSLYCIRTWEHVHSNGGQEQSISNPEKMEQYFSFILNIHLQKTVV